MTTEQTASPEKAGELILNLHFKGEQQVCKQINKNRWLLGMLFLGLSVTLEFTEIIHEVK